MFSLTFQKPLVTLLNKSLKIHTCIYMHIPPRHCVSEGHQAGAFFWQENGEWVLKPILCNISGWWHAKLKGINFGFQKWIKKATMTSQKQISNKILKSNKVRSYILQSPNFSEEECQVPERCIYPKRNCKVGAKLRIRILASPILWVPGGPVSFMVWLLLADKETRSWDLLQVYPHANRPGLWHRSFVISPAAVTSSPIPPPWATPQHLRNRTFAVWGKKLLFDMFIWKPSQLSSRVCYKAD